MMRYRTAVAAACLTISGLVATASPSDAQGPATLRAIGEYRLTMPTLRRTCGRTTCSWCATIRQSSRAFPILAECY